MTQDEADRLNRAGDAKRTLQLPPNAKTPAKRVYATPLDDQAIARCRARAKRRPTR